METMIFIIFFALVFIATFILWKYIHLKHDVYEYTEKLDIAINKMLKNEELKTSSYKQDDLWGKSIIDWFAYHICILTKI